MIKFLKGFLMAVAVLIIAIVITGAAFWLFSGRSPQSFVVSHMLHKTTMAEYEEQHGDQTDKSTVEIPAGVGFPRLVTQFRMGGMQVFQMEPQDSLKPVVLYIHGGAYVHNFADPHWISMAEWAHTTGCGIVTPNYPLLFCYTVNDAFPLMTELYKYMIGRYSSKRIIIMGDSAGGGLSLALSQQLVKDSLSLPAHLVLISPWVDVLGGDDSLQDKDFFLNAEVLRKIGEDWAAGMDPRIPMVSPLYGDMHSLPATDIFSGTWEIFYTDIVATYEKMKASGVDVRLHLGQKMGHVYPLWPCPEGKEARKEISEIINSVAD